MKKAHKKMVLIGIGILIIIGTIIWIAFENKEKNLNLKKYNCTKWYNKTICIDPNSIYFACDVKEEFCSKKYLEAWLNNTYQCRMVN